MNNRWNSGDVCASNVVRYSEARDRRRMGACKWLPSDGDLCVCIALSGDCFYRYVAVRKGDDGIYRKVGAFGAYFFGEGVRNIDTDWFLIASEFKSDEIE